LFAPGLIFQARSLPLPKLGELPNRDYFIAVLFFAVAVALWLPVSFLFPAIATDHRVSFDALRKQTAGIRWRILGAIIVSVLPFALLAPLAQAEMGHPLRWTTLLMIVMGQIAEGVGLAALALAYRDWGVGRLQKNETTTAVA
jgi:hypothetical protein